MEDRYLRTRAFGKHSMADNSTLLGNSKASYVKRIRTRNSRGIKGQLHSWRTISEPRIIKPYHFFSTFQYRFLILLITGIRNISTSSVGQWQAALRKGSRSKIASPTGLVLCNTEESCGFRVLFLATLKCHIVFHSHVERHREWPK